MRLLQAVHHAAEERDLSSLEAAMNSLSNDYKPDELQNLIRREVLPKLKVKSLLWLWRSITSPLQRRQMLSSLSQQTAMKLMRDGFAIGTDFSFREDSDGGRQMMISSEVKNHLESSLHANSLVTLQLLTRHKHVSVP